MADLLPKAETESWCCYRKRILTSFLEAGNEARHTDEGKWGFNRRVKAWASTQSNANYNSRRRNTNESLSSYRRRIEEDFYDNEILRDYRQRVLRKEGKVELNRRIRAWAEGKPYVAPALSSTKTSIFPGGDLQEPSTITITGYVVHETEDGTKNVAFLEHPLFHTTRVIMHMRHVPTDEYNGLHVSSLFNGDGGTEHVYIRHNKYWGSKVVLRRLGFVDNPYAPVLNTYLSYDEPGGLAEPARNVIWNGKYKRLVT